MATSNCKKLERQDSVISILSSGVDLCRICHCDSSCGELISPCYCSGSMRWVHQGCLQHWIRASNNKSCELCRYPYIMRSKLKPPCLWESLPMSASEKRRLFCSAIFHLIALACVIWSLYVLIDRTVEEVYSAELEWQFWTKIVVEAIGCMGAGILIYVWGKSYFSIFNKWVAFNRTFIIVNSSPPPEKKPLQSSKTMEDCSTVNSSKSGNGNGNGGGTKRPMTPSRSTPPQPPLPPPPPSCPCPHQPQEHLPFPSCSGSSSPLMAEGGGIGGIVGIGICGAYDCTSGMGMGGCGGGTTTPPNENPDMMMEQDGDGELDDAHEDSLSSDIENDKSREAKALLLPPIVYNPPAV